MCNKHILVRLINILLFCKEYKLFAKKNFSPNFYGMLIISAILSLCMFSNTLIILFLSLWKKSILLRRIDYCCKINLSGNTAHSEISDSFMTINFRKHETHLTNFAIL